jgi:hypothetical protein
MVMAGGSGDPEHDEATPAMTISTSQPSVAIANTASFNISVQNPFGPIVSRAQARDELLSLLAAEPGDGTTAGDNGGSTLPFRVDYLIKVLEDGFIPPQTVAFFNLIVGGEWELLYSNVLTPRKDDQLLFRIEQEIQPNSATDQLNSGQLINRILWNVTQQGAVATGELLVKTEYVLNSRGGLDVSLREHILLPKELPKDPEELIMSIQRSIPFEFFDPDQAMMINTYLDPALRITKVTGPIFRNVVNIFAKKSTASASAAIAGAFHME